MIDWLFPESYREADIEHFLVFVDTEVKVATNEYGWSMVELVEHHEFHTARQWCWWEDES